MSLNLSKIIFGDSVAIFNALNEELHLETITLGPENYRELLNSFSARRNLLLVEPLPGKSKIGVEQISEVIRFSNQRPHLSNDSVVVIKPFDSVTPEGQNKLLKLLEEPPQYLRVYLLLEGHISSGKVLNTIISRCEIINLGDNQSSNNELLNTIAQDFLADRDRLQLGYKTMCAELDKLKDSGAKIALLKELVKIVNTSIPSTDNKFRGDYSKQQALLNTVNQTYKAVEANANPKLVVDKLFLDLLEIA